MDDDDDDDGDDDDADAAGVGRARLSERRSNGHFRLNGRCPLPPQLRGLPE